MSLTLPCLVLMLARIHLNCENPSEISFMESSTHLSEGLVNCSKSETLGKEILELSLNSEGTLEKYSE